MKKYFRILIFVGIVIFLLATGFFLWATRTNSEGEITEQCMRHGPKGIHIHPQLKIIIDGKEQKIPADIGIISFFCMRPLHTHYEDNIIHVESRTVRDFTIGDFFTIWNKTFTKDCIFEYCTNKGELQMFVNRVEREEFERYVMHDKDDIVINYTKK